MWNCASILGFGTFRTPTLKAFLLVAIAATTGLSAGQENPRNISHSQRSSGNSEFQKAEALIEKGEFAQAAAIIQRQLEQNPTSVEGYNLLGIAYTDAKDFTRANEAFQQALKLAPNSARTHNNLGNLYVAQNKLDLAEKEFKKRTEHGAYESRRELQHGASSNGEGNADSRDPTFSAGAAPER